MASGARFRSASWRGFAALVCLWSVASVLAQAAHAQDSIVAVDAKGMLLGTGDGYSATFSTSFTPQNIQPGQGFTYEGITTYHPAGGIDPFECVDGPQGDMPFGFYKVPAGGTYFTSESEGVQIDGSHASKTCPATGGHKVTTTHVVPGAATAGLEPGCYQGDNWNNTWIFSGSSNSGSLSTLKVGNVGGGCATAVACSDGADNDRDGTVDFPNDPGCVSASDPSELGITACDNGADDDGDGFADVGGGDPECLASGPQGTDEGRACYPVRTALPAYSGRWWGRNTEEAQYEAQVRWCHDGKTVRVVDVSVQADTRPDGGWRPWIGPWVKALERGLRAVADINVEWKARGRTWKSLPGSTPESQFIQVSGGRFAVCHGLPGMGKLSKVFDLPGLRRLSELGRAARRPIAKRLSKVMYKQIRRATRATIVHERKVVYKRLVAKGIPRRQALRIVKRDVDDRFAEFEAKMLKMVNAQINSLIKTGLPLSSPFCWTLWTPKVRVVLPAQGAATWTDAGDITVPRLWQVDSVR